jgi:hypothetical protein|tara:strand:- start:833 stop:1033 length:201 start_codon:yes stop_codon:yes gene_type:complete
VGWGAALAGLLKVAGHLSAFFSRKQLLDAGADRAVRAAQGHALRQAQLAARARGSAGGVLDADYRD